MSRVIRVLPVLSFVWCFVAVTPLLAQQVTVLEPQDASGRAVYAMEAEWPRSLRETLDSTSIDAVDARTALSLTHGQYDASHLLHLNADRLPQVQLMAADYEEVHLPADELPDEVRDALGAPVADVAGLGIMRRQPVANLTLALLRYDASTQTLRRYRRVVAAVQAVPEVDGAVRARRAQTARSATASANPHLNVGRSVLADGVAIKFPVKEEGVYRITRSTLATMLEGTDLDVDEVDPRRLQLFGNGGEPLPALNAAPRPADLVQNPVLVTGADDGSFDEGDALVFHARGVTGWTYSAPDDSAADDGPGAWSHFTHPFAKTNYYFLKLADDDGERVRAGETLSGDAALFEQVPGRHVVDFETFNWHSEAHGTGLTWLSRLMVPGDRLAVLDGVALPGLAAGTVRYQARVATSASPKRAIFFDAGSQRLGTVTPGATGSGRYSLTAATAATGWFTQTVQAGQPLTLRAELEDGSNDPEGAVDWVRLFYTQRLQAEEGYLRFTTPAGESGVMEFVLRGFDRVPRVWDVTQPGGVRALAVRQEGGTYRVRLRVDDASQPRDVVAFTDGGLRTLDASGALRIPRQNLHSVDGHPDFVIVAPEPFVEFAEELAERRRAEGLEVLVAEVETIYNEFSGGVPDMRAVRDFFRFLYDRGPDPADPKLKYALLFGDGHFNYRNLGSDGQATLENWIFPYETVDSFDGDDSYTSDDYFALLDDFEGEWPYAGYNSAAPRGEPIERVDIGVGRLTVQTEEEARAVLDKIYRYESAATAGAWRSRYLFIADDGFNNLSGVNSDDDLHVKNAEAAVDVVNTDAPSMNLRKIYGPAYHDQRVYLNGFRIPAMKQDIRSALHEGVLVFNYSGHGGPNSLMQEQIFSIQDAVALRNRDRPTIFITATCSFGRWDMQEQQSGAEAVFLNPDGGAVAVFTTVRLVYTSRSNITLNPGLNRELNRALFRREEDGMPRRLGAVLQETKNTTVGVTGNSRKFNLLGDPSMRVGLPHLDAEVTDVNGVAIDDTTEAQLRAIEHTTIRGEVRRVDGTIAQDFDGLASVEVYDAARKVKMPYGSSTTDSSFVVREDLIWRGDVAVQQGRFTTEFVVPKDISYRDAPGRISVYAHDGSHDALGFTEAVRVGGTSDQPPDDRRGPRVELFLDDTTFVSGSMTPPDPELIVRLYDENGINAVGAGVGHELLLVVNGQEQHAVNLGSRYTSDKNSFRHGRVQFSLGDYPEPIEPGPNRLKVRAWDVMNNSTESELEFFVSGAEGLQIRNVYNYPNPTTGPSYFVFEHNQPPGTAAEVQVRIYTINGRLVRTLEGHEALPAGVLSSGPVKVPGGRTWDGLDQDGDPLAPGVYLYKLRVETGGLDGERHVSERIERLAVIR